MSKTPLKVQQAVKLLKSAFTKLYFGSLYNVQYDVSEESQRLMEVFIHWRFLKIT